ncbi:hypothetical protein D3C86_1339380 [compost metagenome]
MNASLIRTEMFAAVTLPCSNLASMKSSASGCSIETESINAPRLPSCATSRVELEKRSMNGASPVDVKAEFFTADPFGRM